MADKPKFVFDIPVKPAGKKKEPKKRTCDWDGCSNPGEHKAPVARDDLRKYYWFCMDHVRDYNRHWDYFKGMSDGDVKRFQKNASTGHRPTWSMGSNPYVKGGKAAESRLNDKYSLFDDGPAGQPKVEKAPRRPKVGKLTAESLSELDLDETASLNEVKARYKELVKRYHPDANGGERGAEERLRRVIRAYKQIKSSGYA
jgi:hypothetical protein